MKYKYFILPAFLFFAGCANHSINNLNECSKEPNWIFNIPQDGNIYGVGIAPVNFYGEQAQRKSAISKALNEIATQIQTNVDSKTIMTTYVKNKNAQTTFSNVSFQTTTGQKVSAVVVKSCKNPENGDLYILMKMIKK